LLAASDLELVDQAGRLRTIPGTVPAAGQFPDGCVFRNRCDHEIDRCTTFPPWSEQDGHGFACWNPPGWDARRG
jgi:oligopeptide/dipeptide ABC transporter ATP-binding protein